MPYAFIHDVPANDEIYSKVRAGLPSDKPAGLVAHIVHRTESGLRYTDVWETRSDWERFEKDHVEPVVTEVLASYGLPHDESMTTFTEIEVIDAWVA